MAAFEFQLEAQDGKARAARMTTPHGIVQTPLFMPVGTVGAVKAIMPEQLAASGVKILLANAYHLLLRPGIERVRRLGGLRRFMNWKGAILTDSGGFQIMSLSKMVKIDEDGASFRSHIDGTLHRLTPEKCAEIQCALGSDIQMQLDECVAWPARENRAEEAMARSLRWAARARDAFINSPQRREGQALFGIAQGGVYPSLRRASAEALCEMGFDGYAIGGLAVGEGQEMMLQTLAETLPHLPENAPRYLMGVGTPSDLLEAVRLGVDMFDCVLPAREARHGHVYLGAARVNLRNAAFAEDAAPLDAKSDCPASSGYSRAYLHHLLKIGEPLAATLLTWHNMDNFQKLMRRARQAIMEGRYESYCQRLLSGETLL